MKVIAPNSNIHKKGKRNDVVIEGMKKYKAVYLAAIGGAGAAIFAFVGLAGSVAAVYADTDA